MPSSYTIVYIGASWCSTCKVIKPETEKLAAKFGVALKCLDYDADLDEEAQAAVTKVPTLRILDGETQVAEFNTKQVASLEAWLSQHVNLTTDDF